MAFANQLNCANESQLGQMAGIRARIGRKLAAVAIVTLFAACSSDQAGPGGRTDGGGLDVGVGGGTAEGGASGMGAVGGNVDAAGRSGNDAGQSGGGDGADASGAASGFDSDAGSELGGHPAGGATNDAAAGIAGAVGAAGAGGFGGGMHTGGVGGAAGSSAGTNGAAGGVPGGGVPGSGGAAGNGVGGGDTGSGGSAGSDGGIAGGGGDAGGGGGGAGGAANVCPPSNGADGGIFECHDPCLDDRDHDGVADCADLCPSDPAKTVPGACGCGVVDTDTDVDGTPDCLDACPTDPTRWQAGPCGVASGHCDLTWMTVSNLYVELGPLNVLIDGYVTRIPKSNFYGGGGGLQNTYNPSLPDVAAVSRVFTALGGATKMNLLLTGHSHFDHSFDTATWSFLSGAPIIGSRTTCFQAVAQGVAPGQCTEILGGEKLTLSPGVTMRVIRWNHSGDSTANPEQHNPVELAAVPVPDLTTGGLHAGVAEDFPNGGGGRAFLFTVDGADGPYSWFFLNSAGYADLDVPIVVDGVDYGAPLENLKAAMADAGLTSVDLWVGAGGDPVAQLVLPVVNPKAYLPVHWDNFYAAFGSPSGKYSDRTLAATLTARGVNLITPMQAMDKWRLDRTGVHPIANTAVKQALNIQ